MRKQIDSIFPLEVCFLGGDSKPKNFSQLFRDMLPRACGKAKSETSTSLSISWAGPPGPLSVTPEGSQVGCLGIKQVADQTLCWPQAAL